MEPNDPSEDVSQRPPQIETDLCARFVEGLDMAVATSGALAGQKAGTITTQRIKELAVQTVKGWYPK